MKTTLKKHLNIVLGIISISILLVTSCSSPKPDYENETVATDVEEDNMAQQVFYSLPSPFELASLLRNSGATFNKDILNSPENLPKYTTSSSKATNLGIYGADLSYASIFGQTQASMSYLTCVKGLTDDLGISSAFNKESMTRLEQNKSNDDSLQQIVAEAYLIANSYLKDNDRVNMATFILAGGLIEGLYIATKLAENSNAKDDLNEMVADQKFSIENLVAMLEGYEGDDAAFLLVEFKALMEVYNQVQENADAKTDVQTDAKSSTTVIGGDDELSITSEQVKAIGEKVAAIRTKLIN